MIETRRVPVFTPRPKLGEEVTRYLRDAIMTGEYSGGQRIRAEELACRGVGREPGDGIGPGIEALAGEISTELADQLSGSLGDGAGRAEGCRERGSKAASPSRRKRATRR